MLIEQALDKKNEEISDLKSANQSQASKISELEAQLIEKDKYIAYLSEKRPQPNNIKTVECYQKIQMKKAFDASCISSLAHETEIKKLESFLLLVDLSKVPKVLQDKRKIIYLGMEGCCRQYTKV